MTAYSVECMPRYKMVH